MYIEISLDTLRRLTRVNKVSNKTDCFILKDRSKHLDCIITEKDGVAQGSLSTKSQ